MAKARGKSLSRIVEHATAPVFFCHHEHAGDGAGLVPYLDNYHGSSMIVMAASPEEASEAFSPISGEPMTLIDGSQETASSFDEIISGTTHVGDCADCGAGMYVSDEIVEKASEDDLKSLHCTQCGGEIESAEDEMDMSDDDDSSDDSMDDGVGDDDSEGDAEDIDVSDSDDSDDEGDDDSSDDDSGDDSEDDSDYEDMSDDSDDEDDSSDDDEGDDASDDDSGDDSEDDSEAAEVARMISELAMELAGDDMDMDDSDDSDDMSDDDEDDSDEDDSMDMSDDDEDDSSDDGMDDVASELEVALFDCLDRSKAAPNLLFLNDETAMLEMDDKIVGRFHKHKANKEHAGAYRSHDLLRRTVQMALVNSEEAGVPDELLNLGFVPTKIKVPLRKSVRAELARAIEVARDETVASVQEEAADAANNYGKLLSIASTGINKGVFAGKSVVSELATIFESVGVRNPHSVAAKCAKNVFEPHLASAMEVASELAEKGPVHTGGVAAVVEKASYASGVSEDPSVEVASISTAVLPQAKPGKAAATEVASGFAAKPKPTNSYRGLFANIGR